MRIPRHSLGRQRRSYGSITIQCYHQFVASCRALCSIISHVDSSNLVTAQAGRRFISSYASMLQTRYNNFKVQSSSLLLPAQAHQKAEHRPDGCGSSQPNAVHTKHRVDVTIAPNRADMNDSTASNLFRVKQNGIALHS